MLLYMCPRTTIPLLCIWRAHATVCVLILLFVLMQVVQFLVGAGRIPRTKVSKIVEAMPSLLGHRSLILLHTIHTLHILHILDIRCI